MVAGPDDGPVVILLHGFPEFWYGWNKQIEPLSAAGLRVVVPDQRGYNESSKPSNIRDYRMSELTADVLAVADQLGAGTFGLAGHDWGAAVAWNAAINHPDRVSKLAILNVPHPAAMMHALRTTPRQVLRSWYMLFFQIPKLPEFLVSRRNYKGCEDALRNTSRPGTFTDEDMARYREAWSHPGAMTGMINWYRALFREVPATTRRVTVPTRILWGMRDAFLIAELAVQSSAFCDRSELVEFPDASHWLQHEEPQRVNELLVGFFAQA